jgi:hypothetical protein
MAKPLSSARATVQLFAVTVSLVIRARRIRLRASTTKTRKPPWVELHPVLADAVEASLPPREDRDPEARLFPGSGADAGGPRSRRCARRRAM